MSIRMLADQQVKVLIVSFEYPPDTGGIGAYTHEIACGMAARDFEVHVLTHRTVAALEAKNVFDEGLPFQIGQIRGSRNFLAVQKAIAGFRPDVVIAFDLVSVMLCRPLTLLNRRPLIAVGHGSEFRGAKWWKSAVKRLAYRTCRHMVFVSQFTLGFALRNGYSTRRYSIIPPGGNQHVHQPGHEDRGLLKRLGLAGHPFILTVGTLSTRKGQDIVLRAMKVLRARHPELRYCLVGRDMTEGSFAAMAQAMGIADRTVFAGAVDTSEKVALYGDSVFNVITSRTEEQNIEGYGIAVIEAALCGKTCIGTSGTGLQEAILDGETGLLVPQDDPIATAGAIDRLLDDVTYRERLEKQAYRRAIADCTWDARSQAFEELIHQIVSP